MPVVGESKLTSIPPLLERAKLAFVVALRSAFQSSVTDKNLKYDPSEQSTKLKIYTAHPLRLEFFPSLVVSTGGGDMSFTYLGDDFVEENDNNEVVFAGRLIFTMSLTILSRSTLERERILDHLIIFVRHLFRAELHRFGLEFTRDIRVGPETLTEIENTPVYEQVLDIPCYMEYEARIDQGAFDCLRIVDIDAVAKESLDG
jgi:hypothetical protein